MSPYVLIPGSSPLARGLLFISDALENSIGIIPARAGFTLLVLHSNDVADGSSPLARGLRQAHVVELKPSGIIPARAGFTLGDRRDSNGGPPYQGAFAFTGDLGTARLSCGSVVAEQRSTTTPSPV